MGARASGAGPSNGRPGGAGSQAASGQADGGGGAGPAAVPGSSDVEAESTQTGPAGGLRAGTGSPPLDGGEPPPEESTTHVDRVEVEPIDPSEWLFSLPLPVSGLVIKPDHLNPQTATGRHTAKVCEEYSEGSPEDLYLEQIPLDRRALIRRYYANLRQQMEPAKPPPTSQPAETDPEQP